MSHSLFKIQVVTSGVTVSSAGSQPTIAYFRLSGAPPGVDPPYTSIGYIQYLEKSEQLCLAEVVDNSVFPNQFTSSLGDGQNPSLTTVPGGDAIVGVLGGSGNNKVYTDTLLLNDGGMGAVIAYYPPGAHFDKGEAPTSAIFQNPQDGTFRVFELHRNQSAGSTTLYWETGAYVAGADHATCSGSGNKISGFSGSFVKASFTKDSNLHVAMSSSSSTTVATCTTTSSAITFPDPSSSSVVTVEGRGRHCYCLHGACRGARCRHQQKWCAAVPHGDQLRREGQLESHRAAAWRERLRSANRPAIAPMTWRDDSKKGYIGLVYNTVDNNYGELKFAMCNALSLSP